AGTINSAAKQPLSVAQGNQAVKNSTLSQPSSALQSTVPTVSACAQQQHMPQQRTLMSPTPASISSTCSKPAGVHKQKSALDLFSELKGDLLRTLSSVPSYPLVTLKQKFKQATNKDLNPVRYGFEDMMSLLSKCSSFLEVFSAADG